MSKAVKRGIFLFLIAVGLVAYFVRAPKDEVVIEDKSLFEVIKDEKISKLPNIPQESIKKRVKVAPLAGQNIQVSQTKSSDSLSAPKGEARVLSEAELDAMEEYFDKTEQNWAATIQDLFVEKFNLTLDDYNTYLRIRDEYDQAKEAAYNKFHEKLIAKYGEDYSYRATQVDEQFENTVLPEFQKKLIDIIGQENFKEYLKTLDAYNDKLRKEQDPRRGMMYMEL